MQAPVHEQTAPTRLLTGFPTSGALHTHCPLQRPQLSRSLSAPLRRDRTGRLVTRAEEDDKAGSSALLQRPTLQRPAAPRPAPAPSTPGQNGVSQDNKQAGQRRQQNNPKGNRPDQQRQQAQKNQRQANQRHQNGQPHQNGQQQQPRAQQSDSKQQQHRDQNRRQGPGAASGPGACLYPSSGCRQYLHESLQVRAGYPLMSYDAGQRLIGHCLNAMNATLNCRVSRLHAVACHVRPA